MFINKKVNFGLSLFLKGKKMPVALFVEFEIKPQLKAEFVKRVCEHRNNVLSKEKYCQQFDVLIPEKKQILFVYMKYMTMLKDLKNILKPLT